MIFYPLLSAPGCQGYTILSNFPPNNWESKNTKSKYVHVTWLENQHWHTEFLQTIVYGQFLTITSDDLCGIVPESSLPLLSLLDNKVSTKADTLPDHKISKTVMPSWRATLGLKGKEGSTSYQGEIEPFPEKASLVTFCPFIQREHGVHNYLILMNLNRSNSRKMNAVELRNAGNQELIMTYQAFSNGISIIDLNDMDSEQMDFPVIVCKEMAAIPLYFSMDQEGQHLSLEHTHPPASLVIHGDRWAVQRSIKENWITKGS
jgi:hypothetical protein